MKLTILERLFRYGTGQHVNLMGPDITGVDCTYLNITCIYQSRV